LFLTNGHGRYTYDNRYTQTETCVHFHWGMVVTHQ
jgi:hypothetical protein